MVVSYGLASPMLYSLPPLRLSGRGTLTSALLPLGYVAVPYLTGAFSSGAGITELSPRLLIGLYLGFMGRLVLKDFRDEAATALRKAHHARPPWPGSADVMSSPPCSGRGVRSTLRAFREGQPHFAALTAYGLVVLVMLADITRDRYGVQDVARHRSHLDSPGALVYTVLIQLATTMNGWTTAGQSLVVGLATVASLGMAWECRRALLPVADPLTDQDRQLFSRTPCSTGPGVGAGVRRLMRAPTPMKGDTRTTMRSDEASLDDGRLLTGPEGISPEWLTTVLCRSGAISHQLATCHIP